MGTAHDLRRGRALGALLCASVWLLMAASARADQASGTWTGEVEAHGNYFLERSTRVEVPTGRISLEAPNGMRVSASYLVDIIASASVAQGSQADQVHIELRHGIGLAAGKTLAVGENELDVTANAIFSTESDYTSWIFGGRIAYSMNQKNTVFSLGVTSVNDTIYQNQRAAPRKHFGDLNGVTLNFGFSQILTPVLTFGAGYQLVYLNGFLGNAYRQAYTGPLPNPERPPETRIRHNLEATAALYLPPTSTTLQLFGRFYTDSWKVNAITPELRIYQALGRDFNLRLRARVYAQSRAYFAQPNGMVGRYERYYTGYLTGDPKLSDFHNLELGLRISYALRGLEGTALDFVSRGVLDLSIDRQWSTIAVFGSNFFVILGGRLPF